MSVLINGHNRDLILAGTAKIKIMVAASYDMEFSVIYIPGAENSAAGLLQHGKKTTIR